MKSIMNSVRGRLIGAAVLVAVILSVCFVCVLNANATENEENGDRVINLTKYTLIGGRIWEESVTIPSTETADKFSFSLAGPKPSEDADGEFGEGEQGDLYILKFQCGSYSQDLTAEFYHEGKCSDIAFFDSYGAMHLCGEEMSYSLFDPYGTGKISLDVMFYGENLYVGYVYGLPIEKHSYFDLTVNIPGTDIPVPISTAASIIGFDWPWGDAPSYLYEMLSADTSIVADRPYNVDADGTLHVTIGVSGIDTKLNAKAVGKSGAVFKNWVLNDTVIPNGSSGTTPQAAKIEENLYGYELVATFYNDEELVTVKFDSQGGSEVASQTIEKGEKLTKPTDPTKEYCKFDGWFTNAACTGTPYDFTQAVNESFTLYAKWIELPHIIEGSDAVWYYGSAQGLTFKSSAKLTDFLRVTVDGDEVDASAYTLGTDETITVTLSPDYMNFMSEGTHELGIVSNLVANQANEEYVAKCNFTVTFEPVPVNPTNGPGTGDCLLWIAVLTAFCGCLVFTASKLRRRNSVK